MSTTPHLITRAEAARLLQVSERTFDRYREQHRLTVQRTPGGKPRFRRDEVMALLSAPTT